jgi:hypothetical protein
VIQHVEGDTSQVMSWNMSSLNAGIGEPGKIKFISNIMTIKIETEIINQRLLVILSENIPKLQVSVG